ncbi:MAG: hypothetical protein J6J83_08030 [Oscillospiraceae bacterium]|nr:hypothetical protein [Oscillospiraceae bacterium]
MGYWIVGFFAAAIILLLLLFVILALVLRKDKYDKNGFNRRRIHRNGTKYDDQGFDYWGYDRSGYDRCGYNRYGYDRSGYDRYGYDRYGYDRSGYNRQGYNTSGKNAKGQYNRCYDEHGLRADGFCDPCRYPIALTDHARERMRERLGITDFRKMDAAAREAYQYGRSARQIKKSAAAMAREIEQRHDGKIVLIHRGYIYIFSEENVLITLYKNDRIPL